MSVRVAIAGASGYAGGEAARLLAAHPEVSHVTLCAHSNAGAPVEAIHPHLHHFAGEVFRESTLEVLDGHDVVVLALPHGESGALGERVREADPNRLVIDLGADRRLVDPEAWSEFYSGPHHAPFVYGMPELVRADGTRQRDALLGATAVAVPGCNATAVTLALAPLVAAGAVQPTDLSAVLAVGPSGAGRVLRADLLAAELLGSARPYAVGGVHRHTPEILQNLALAGGTQPSISLTPVLVPMSRGILATCTALRTGDHDAGALRSILADAYADEPFVRVVPADSWPQTSDVLGSNTVSIGLALDHSVNRVVVVAAIDNLVKGTAGAAVQCMNLALGYDEALGLPVDGVAP